jgi:putative ABC transport system permease protein
MSAEGNVLIPPFVSFWTAIIAMGVLILSGVLAGLMPALRALRIKAIDAIRDE